MKKILVVDDEFDIRDMLTDFLTINNIEVKTASNGREALEIFSEFEPDLAIADIKMEIMDGIEFSKQVLAGKPDFPIVMITGHVKEYDLQEILSLGVKKVIVKPLHLNNFLTTLKQYMH